MSDAKDDDFWRQRPGYRVQRIDYLPETDLSRPISATLRGSRSGRVISVGDAVRAEDGDLVLTMASEGAVIPSCSVTFVDDPPERCDSICEDIGAALAEALFGWLR